MRRRGNPNWGHPMLPAMASPTEFERLVKQLRLTEWGIEVELSYGIR